MCSCHAACCMVGFLKVLRAGGGVEFRTPIAFKIVAKQVIIKVSNALSLCSRMFV